MFIGPKDPRPLDQDGYTVYVRIPVIRLTAGFALFFAPGPLRAVSVQVTPRTTARTGAVTVPVVVPRLNRPVLNPGKMMSWSTLPRVSAPQVLPLPSAPAQPDALVPAVLPSARTEAISESIRSTLPDARISAERVSEISAKVFDGKAEAPVVSAGESSLTPRVLKRAVRLIITGPPGSGKGTYSQLLSRQYGIPHISVGALLRDYARTQPAVAARMATGKLVDTELVLRVVSERLKLDDVIERGFILDGFPRRVVEARALKTMLGDSGIDAVISLDAPEPELLRRILGRGRVDDSTKVFTERMRIYREDTLPAMKLFRKNKPVIAPDVAGPDAQINYSDLKTRFERWVESEGLK